ncbi:hypothetical protein AVEN_174493-1 [Araneus ventricosus]|uniref:Uncharacterized protein n=1 Tax=Araneus ventricosus TaxID=182803 RepID=A0A4Y2UKV5_ARAVE|nr:hypothetical protein AVEN_231767-1 [Araneus ventricosus]GBO13297.1 hypothetical protein AVEN_174493-1 [Araneus ventricosus]
MFAPYTHRTIFVTLVSEVGQFCMVNTRSQTKMAANSDLFALLAELKKSVEQGDERMEKIIGKGQEEMKKGQEEMKKGQEEMKNTMD